jgi:molecular chaperone DnaK (HSP70)
MAHPGAEHGSASKQADTAGMPDFRIAIDFGTTFTTVAFINYKRSKDVFTIEEFPEDDCNDRNGTQVPTEIWYSDDNKDRTSTRAGRSEGQNVLYGYEITRRLELPANDPSRAAYKNGGLVTKPKLLLDDSAHVSDLRKDLIGVLHQLKEERIIKEDEEVIEHLLACFLKHTKSVLQRDHKFSDDSKGNPSLRLSQKMTLTTLQVEVTFTVPVCWSAKVVSMMSSCLQAAMVTARFGTEKDSNPHIFIVNEAEAAAMHAIDTRNTSIEVRLLLQTCSVPTTDQSA